MYLHREPRGLLHGYSSQSGVGSGRTSMITRVIQYFLPRQREQR